MCPPNAIDNAIYGVFVDAKLVRYFLLRYTILVKMSNLTHFFSGQICLVMRLTLYPGVAAFSHFVLHIVKWRASKQVVWVNARGIVASMASKLAVFQWAMMEFATKTMSRIGNVIDAELTVPSTAHRSRPQPTFVLLPANDLSPEYFLRRVSVMATVVPGYKAHRLSFDVPVSLAGFFGYRSGITASTFTEFNAIRGIMGLHRNLSFLVPSLGTFRDVAGATLLGYYSFILAQMDWYCNRVADLLEVASQ